MPTLWFWSAMVILGITLLGALPGMRDLIRPSIAAISVVLTEIIKFTGGYVVWVIKRILVAHIEVARHLSRSRAFFDPAERIKEEGHE